MKTVFLIIALAATGCASILDIPDRHLASDSRCTGTIKIKILYDGSGPTSDVGIPFFTAQKDFIRDINESGGIRGCQIDYEAMDYGYSPGMAQMIYNTWKSQPDFNDVVAILGWGSSDSVQLAPQVRDDRKPFISASYIGTLAAPNPVVRDEMIPELESDFTEKSFPQHFTSDGFGYNFFAGTDYSTGARIAMFHVSASGGHRVGFFFCDQSDYCPGPIPAAETFAKTQGLLLGRKLTVELTDNQATYNTNVRNYFVQEKAQQMADPTYQMVDWVWGGNTTATTALLANALYQVNQPVAMGGLGLNIQLIVNNWGFDENLFAGCSPAAACIGRVHGIMPFVAYGDTRAGAMAQVIALHDKWRARDGSTTTYKNVRYVQGYVNVLLFQIAVDHVITSGKPITGDNIKEALETLKGIQTGGLTGQLTFSPTDHRPQSTESIYMINSSGALTLESQRTITMDDDWLGW